MSVDDRMINSSNAFLTPPEIANRLRVSPNKVLGWIRRGMLGAVNVSDGLRPRYRVSREALDAFLQGREVRLPPCLRRKRQCTSGGPIDSTLGEALLKKKQAVMVGKDYYRVWNGVILFY